MQKRDAAVGSVGERPFHDRRDRIAIMQFLEWPIVRPREADDFADAPILAAGEPPCDRPILLTLAGESADGAAFCCHDPNIAIFPKR
jgi:hypothetical protein